jgi:hypothetical protein
MNLTFNVYGKFGESSGSCETLFHEDGRIDIRILNISHEDGVTGDLLNDVRSLLRTELVSKLNKSFHLSGVYKLEVLEGKRMEVTA